MSCTLVFINIFVKAFDSLSKLNWKWKRGSLKVSGLSIIRLSAASPFSEIRKFESISKLPWLLSVQWTSSCVGLSNSSNSSLTKRNSRGKGGLLGGREHPIGHS